jgi:hypothetical protein
MEASSNHYSLPLCHLHLLSRSRENDFRFSIEVIEKGTKRVRLSETVFTLGNGEPFKKTARREGCCLIFVGG